MPKKPHQLSASLNHPQRLQIMACLDAVEFMTIPDLLEILDVVPPILSKQLRVLEDEGYLNRLRFADRHGTFVACVATPRGRKAYAEHIAALRAIVNDPLSELANGAGRGPQRQDATPVAGASETKQPASDPDQKPKVNER